MVIAPLISKGVFAETKMLMNDPKIIIVSKVFQPSLKYTLGSIAISFMTASVMNITVKI
jgi:hypothetical protein